MFGTSHRRVDTLQSVLGPARPSEAKPRTPISRLVLSFDIGATKTAVSAAVQFADKRWEVIQVSRWKGQDGKDLHEQKVPTALLYSDDGKTLVACGAEALTPAMRPTAKEWGWRYVQNFKLGLHPKQYLMDVELNPLPKNVGIVKVYTDFLRYTFNHSTSQVKEWFGDRDVWAEMSERAEVILATPNMWGKPEQEQLMTAVVNAGILSKPRVKDALFFVEEGEASARFSLLRDSSGFASTQLKTGTKFIVCDAGGSTVDISSYTVDKKTEKSLKLREFTANPESVLAGGCRIDEECERYLRRIFSKGGLSADRIERMTTRGVRDFESYGKRTFGDPSKACDVTIAGDEESYLKLGIHYGMMSIDYSDAEIFFKRHVDLIAAAIKRQVDSNDGVECIILTGGLGESPYLKRIIKEAFPNQTVFTPTGSTSQAVAIGALLLVMGNGDVEVDRLPRGFPTWATNFFKRIRVLLSPKKSNTNP